MALKIRLRRMGRKNAPTYRIVVAESSMPRDGRIVASIGHYNPRTEPLTLAVDRSKALEWLEKGAMPTDTARALLKKAGVFRPEEAVEEDQGVLATAAVAAAQRARQVATGAKSLAAKVADAVEDVAEKVADKVGDVVGREEDAQAEARSQTDTPPTESSPAGEPEVVASASTPAGESIEAEEAKS